MIPQKLKLIFFTSIPVFIAHGLEEYLTGFYNIDPISKFVFGYFNNLPTPQATFLLFQIILWLTLIVFAFLIAGEKWRFRLLLLPGIIYIFELHHFWKAIEFGRYYPGLVTAIAFPILGYLFWAELLKHENS